MHIRPIRTEQDYQTALEQIEALFDAEPGTPEADLLDVLVTLVERYEDLHYAIPDPDPVEAIMYFMESRGLTRADLQPYIGTRARVSEILNRRRTLTLRMIQRLNQGLGIPAEVLVKPYEIEVTCCLMVVRPADDSRCAAVLAAIDVVKCAQPEQHEVPQ